MFLSKITTSLAKRSLKPKSLKFQKASFQGSHPIYSGLRSKSTPSSDNSSEKVKANSASDIISSFPWLYGTQPDRSYYPYIKPEKLKPGLTIKLINSIFSKPYYAKLLAFCFSEDKGYFWGDFKDGARYAFKVLTETLSSHNEADLKALMTPRLLDRYSEALSELKSQNCKIQLSVEEIHEIEIRDIRITFGPKEDSDSTPADLIKGNVGFVSFILPKGKSLGNKYFLEAHASGAIFRVDAAINADLHYQITSSSGEILNTRYNRTHVVTFVNPHMKPNSHGLYSEWCWYMDDIDFLLDSEAGRFPEGSSDKEEN